MAAATSANRRIVRGAMILVAILAIPVVALILLQAGVFLACATDTLGQGTLEGAIEWRITRMQCRNGREPYYDVAVGAADKTLVTALTSRGAPVPVSVEKIGEGSISVRLDRPRPGTTEDTVRIGLRRSGSPRERVDLQADGQKPSAAAK